MREPGRSSFNIQKKLSTYSLRQYLLPRGTEDLASKILKHKNCTLDLDILVAIGDLSVPTSQQTLQRRLISLYKKIGFAIRPDNPFLLIWQLLIMLIIIYYIVQIGLLLGFGEAFWQDEYSVLLGVQISFVVVLGLDILLSPLKAFYAQGLLIKDISQILKRYTKLEVYLDLMGLVSVMLPLIIGSVQSNWIKILWFVKIYTMDKINDQFERITQLYIVVNTCYLVIKLVLFSFFYAHYMGIFFYLVSLGLYNSNYYGPNTPNLVWVYNSWAFYQMAFLNWLDMYTYIIYFGIQVVTTIAYGDITPKNPLECIYIIFALITQAILWGYILSQILRLLINVYTYNFERRFHHFALNFKLKTSMVSDSTFRQVQKHTEEIDRDQQYRNRTIEDNILSFLPPDPLYGMLLVIYKSSLKRVGFDFVQNLSYRSLGPADCKSLFLQTFMRAIKEQRHFAGDVFYTKGEIEKSKPCNHNVYFYTSDSYKHSVVLGVGEHIEIGLQAGESSHTVIEKKGSFELCRPKRMFGNIQFLNGQERSHWAICLLNCLLFVVSRETLVDNYNLLTLQQKESLELSREKSQIRECYLCKEEHFFIHCPYVFAASKNITQQNQKVSRANRLRSLNHTRIRSMSALRLYPQIRDMKMSISSEYKKRLFYDKLSHSLFLELELQQNFQEEGEDLEQELHETEVMIDNLYKQELEQLGLNEEQWSYEKAYNFKVYKPSRNINTIAKKAQQIKLEKRKRRNANKEL